MNRLRGKVVLVTRDMSGLADAVAEAFAAEGAAVELGGGGSLPLDPTDEASCRDALAAVEARYGRLDALCNLATAAPALRPLHEVDEGEWDAAVRDTVRSTLLVSRFALPLLRRGGGAIVNVSHAAALVGVPGTGLLAATTGALLNMTRAMAASSRADRVRVNCVCVGSSYVPVVPSELEQHRAQRISPAELAGLFVFLASDAAAHVNGQVIPADDGMTAWR